MNILIFHLLQVSFLAKFTGKNEAGVIWEMIRTIMTDNIAQHFVCLGRGDANAKKAFKLVVSLTSSKVN